MSASKGKAAANRTKEQAENVVDVAGEEARAGAERASAIADDVRTGAQARLKDAGYAVLGLGDATVAGVRSLGSTSSEFPEALRRAPELLTSAAGQLGMSLLQGYSELAERGRTITGKAKQDPKVHEARQQTRTAASQAKGAATRVASEAAGAADKVRAAADTVAGQAGAGAKQTSDEVRTGAKTTANQGAAAARETGEQASAAAKETGEQASTAAKTTAGQGKAAAKGAGEQAKTAAKKTAKKGSSAATDVKKDTTKRSKGAASQAKGAATSASKAAKSQGEAASSTASKVGTEPDTGTGSLDDRTVEQLRARAAELDIEGRSNLKKDELVKAIRDAT